MPDRYEELIAKPISVGDIISNIVEGLYRNPAEVLEDFNLIASNCETYQIAMIGEEAREEVLLL